MELFKIEFPFVPESINKFAGRKNTWAYREHQEEIVHLIKLLTLKNKPQKPFDKIKIQIEFYFKTNSGQDSHNYHKPILDGLTRAGIIADDSIRNVNPICIYGYVDKKNPYRTIITITDEYIDFEKK